MKKIFLTLVVTAAIFSVKAQSNQKNSVPALASEIANKTVTEDPHNPLVNGIPYNQYKAQVQAEEKKKTAQETKAKIQQKEFLDKQAKINLPPKPNVAEKPKK